MVVKDVEVVITTEIAPITRAGFGVPLVFDTDAEFDYTEIYEDGDKPAELSDAGEAMVDAILAQSPRPQQIAVYGSDLSWDTSGDENNFSDALDALINLENDWYFLLCVSSQDEVIEELAGWAATNDKLFFALIDHEDGDGAPDSPVSIEGLDHDRAVVIWHNEDGEEAAAAWVGRCAPEDPGSITWKFKTLDGINAADISASDVGNLHDEGINAYIRKLGIDQTSEGMATSGEYIDVVRGKDWLIARISEGVHRLLFESPKVPYDSSGIAQVVAELESVLQRGVDQGIIRLDEDGNGEWEVSVPAMEDIPTDDIANRILPDIEFVAYLAGAVHEVKISGVLRV